MENGNIFLDIFSVKNESVFDDDADQVECFLNAFFLTAIARSIPNNLRTVDGDTDLRGLTCLTRN